MLQRKVWQVVSKYFYDLTDATRYASERSDWEKQGDFANDSPAVYPKDASGNYYLGNLEVSNQIILKHPACVNYLSYLWKNKKQNVYQNTTAFTIMCFISSGSSPGPTATSIITPANNAETSMTQVFYTPHTADYLDILIFGSNYNSDATQVALQKFGIRNFVFEINVCHSSCKNCDNSKSDIRSCIECYSSAFTLVPALKGMCTCQSNSYMIINNPCSTTPCAACSLCHANCLTCFQSGPYGCLTCRSDSYYYNNQCFIQCDTGTYQDEVNKICGDCYPSCLQCSGPGNQQCISCKQPGPGIKYLDINQCVDSCPIGKYINSTLQTCQLCNNTCYQCDGPADTSCTDCSSPYFFQDLGVGNRKCLLVCLNQYYPDSVNRICAKCSTECGNCIGPNTTDCSSCGLGVANNKYYLQGTTCVQSSGCFSSTFPDNVSYTCKACHTECKECTGQLNTNCTKCSLANSRYLYGSSCVLSCQIMFYQDATDPLNPVCSPCDPSCAACNNAGPNECTKCPLSINLQLKIGSTTNGQCKLFCDSHFYPDANFICRPCFADCAECNGPLSNQCTSCTGLRYLTNTFQCLTTCPDGYYGDTNICKTCNLTLCKTCVTTDSTCLSCNGVQFLDVNVCVNTCPADKYTSIIDMKCYKCFANCLTCEGSNNTQCITCQPTTPYFYQNLLDTRGQCTNDCNLLSKIKFDGPIYQNNIPQVFLCLDVCPQYYFKDLSGPTPSCTRCHSSCLECATQNVNGCTKCYDPYYLQNGSCQFCTSGKFGDIDVSGNRICSDCNPACRSCFGNNSNNCTDCALGQYLNVNTNTCGSCPINSFGYQQQCVQTCPLGLYGQAFPERICKQCDLSCATCFDRTDSNCYSCNNTFYLYLTSCKSTCVDGTWPKPVSSTTLEPVCSPCDSSCNTCVGELETDCRTCRDGRFLYNNQQCLTQCPDIYYGQSKGGINLCVLNCDDDQWQDISDNQCKQCSQECVKCTGPNYKFCLQCSTGYIRFQDMCVKVCPDGFWMNDLTKTCDSCTDQCQKCEQNLLHKCLKCSSKYFLNEGVCIDKCPDLLQPNIELQICVACPDKTYTLYDSVKKQISCLDCHFSCSKCSGPEQDQCTVCEPTRGENGLIPLKGYCFCHNNLIDKLEKTCYEKGSLDEFVQGSQTLSFFTTTIISGFIGIFGNPTVLFSFIEISQQLSYLQYLNSTFPVDYDNFNKRFYGYNINNLLINPLTEIDLGGEDNSKVSSSSSSGRVLQNVGLDQKISIDQQNQSNNAYLKDQKASDKFYFNDKTSSFLYNSFTILLITLFFWLLALIFRFIRYVYRKVHYKSEADQLELKKKDFTMGNKISAVLTVGLPFIIFQVTSLEFMLYSLLQYKDMNDKTMFNFISFCICVVASVYFLLMIYYIYYVLNIVKKHRKQNYYSKWSFLWSQVNFQKSKIRRNFFLLLIFKKFLICVLIVFLQERVELQMLGIFLLSALTLGYMLFLNPYQDRFYRYVSIFAYGFMCCIHCCVLIYTLTTNTNHQVKSIIAATIFTAILMLFYCIICIIELVRTIPIIFKILKKIFAHKKDIQQPQPQSITKRLQKQEEDDSSSKNELNQNSVVNPLNNLGSDEDILEEELGPKHLQYSSDEDSNSNDEDDENEDNESENEDQSKKKYMQQDIPLTQFMLNNKRELSRSGSVQSNMTKSGIKQSASIGNMGNLGKNNNNNYSIKFRLPRAESQLEYQISNQKFSEVFKNQNYQMQQKDATLLQLQPEIVPEQSKKKLRLKGLKQTGNLMNSLKVLQQSDNFIRNSINQQQSKLSQPQLPLKKPPKVNEKKTRIQNLLKGMNFDQEKKKINEYEDTPFY